MIYGSSYTQNHLLTFLAKKANIHALTVRLTAGLVF